MGLEIPLCITLGFSEQPEVTANANPCLEKYGLYKTLAQLGQLMEDNTAQFTDSV